MSHAWTFLSNMEKRPLLPGVLPPFLTSARETTFNVVCVRCCLYVCIVQESLSLDIPTQSPISVSRSRSMPRGETTVSPSLNGMLTPGSHRRVSPRFMRRAETIDTHNIRREEFEVLRLSTLFWDVLGLFWDKKTCLLIPNLWQGNMLCV